MREHHPEIWISVSATTRRRRPGEQDGVHYHFVSDEPSSTGWSPTTSCSSGPSCTAAPATAPPASPVVEALAEGRPALLEIDLQGARQVRERMPEALFVFLAPPSWEELVRRLVGRGTEDEAERERRLETAREELAAEPEFDVTVVNRRIHDAGEELVELMRSGRPRHDGPASPDRRWQNQSL